MKIKVHLTVLLVFSLLSLSTISLCSIPGLCLSTITGPRRVAAPVVRHEELCYAHGLLTRGQRERLRVGKQHAAAGRLAVVPQAVHQGAALAHLGESQRQLTGIRRQLTGIQRELTGIRWVTRHAFTYRQRLGRKPER